MNAIMGNYKGITLATLSVLAQFFCYADEVIVRSNPLNISYNMAQIKSTDLNHDAASGDGMYTIDLPGYYFLATDLLPNPVHDGVACIKITANNVTLDLNGKAIMQAEGNNKTMIALYIGQNQSGVDIKNGSITGINGNGIFIDAGCTQIQLHTVAVTGCSTIGILAYKSRNIELQDIRVKKGNDSSDDGPGFFGIKFQESSNITVLNVKSNSHVSKANSAIGFLLQGAKNCTFTDCDALNNSGAQSFGFYADQQTSSCQFIRCNASGNISNASAGASCGFYFIDTDYNYVRESQSLANSAVKGNAYGFYTKNSRGCIMQDCSARGITAEGTASNAYGFYFESSASLKITNCTSFSQITSGGDAYGYFVRQGRAHAFSDCVAKDVDATAGVGNAFGFYSQNGMSNTFTKCQAIGNRSGDSASSRCAGFALVGTDYFSVLNECESRGNISGAAAHGGTAYGIVLDGSVEPVMNAQVRQCTLANNTGGKSYGYCDTSDNSTTLLLANVSFGHGKCMPVDKNKRIVDTGKNNYLFKYDVSSKNPTNIITETHISNLQVMAASTSYMNLSVVND